MIELLLYLYKKKISKLIIILNKKNIQIDFMLLILHID